MPFGSWVVGIIHLNFLVVKYIIFNHLMKLSSENNDMQATMHTYICSNYVTN